MHTEVRTVTPSEAKYLLTKNSVNRPLKKNQVAFFESQLQHGGMLLTHQGIALSEHGQLLDGQHRLHAIVNTGIAADLLIAYDLPRDVFSVIDTGANRSAADVLAIDGAGNSLTMASAIRSYLLYHQVRGNWNSNKSIRSHLTAAAIAEEYQKDISSWEWAAHIGTKYNARSIAAAGPLACVAYIARAEQEYHPEYFELFCSKLKDGDNLQSGDPILAYRNKFLGSNAVVKRVATQARIADLIKLFNAYATSQKL